MKNQLKILVAGICILISTIGTSQNLILEGGLNLNGIGHPTFVPIDGKASMKPGFHIGLAVETPISRIYSIVPAIVFSTRGWNYSETAGYSGSNYTEENISYFLEMPLNFRFKFKIDRKTSIYAQGGPYLAIGLYGETTHRLKEPLDPNYPYNEYSSYMEGPFERVDIGTTLGVGIIHKSLIAGISVEQGFNPIYTEHDTGYRSIKLTIGYLIN